MPRGILNIGGIVTESEKYEALENFLESLGEKQSIKIEKVREFVESKHQDIRFEDALDYLAANGITVIGIQREDIARHYRKDDPLWLYIKEVGKVKILGKERELEVATRLQNSLYSIKSLIPMNTMLIQRIIEHGKIIKSRELPLDEFTKATSGDPNSTTDEKRTVVLGIIDIIAQKNREINETTSRWHKKEISKKEYHKAISNLHASISGELDKLELTARALIRFEKTLEKIGRYSKNIGQGLDEIAKSIDTPSEAFREKINLIIKKDISVKKLSDEMDVSSEIIHDAVLVLRREKRIEKRLRETCMIPLEDFIEELDKLPSYWEIYEECKRLLIEANVRLVINIAKNYTNQGVDFLDLIQEGNAALIKAVERFDPERGYKLGTYAIWWIRQAMLRTLAEQSHVVKLPTYLVQWIRRYSRISQELSQKLGREPTPFEISSDMEVEPDKSSKMRRFFTGQVSLNKSLGDDDSRTLEDVLADESENSPLNIANLTMLQSELKRVLDTLTPKEQRVISLRFGLEDNVPRTLEEIGQTFDLSRERIRQIEMKALSKLRHPSKLEKLLPYLKE
jgi:RNA polymerase primary sigma factor